MKKDKIHRLWATKWAIIKERSIYALNIRDETVVPVVLLR